MYYDVKDVATIIGCGVETVRRWINQGELKAIKMHNHYKIKKEDIYEMLLTSNSGKNKDEIADYLKTITNVQEV